MKALAVIAILAAAMSATPLTAQTPLSVAAFDSITLRGGGHVRVRHGNRQSVTLVRGNSDMTRFRVRSDGKLEIDACVRSCSNYDLEIEIVTPELEGVGVEGGGSILAEGAFPDRDQLALGVNGGGRIDMRVISVRNVSAGIQGGGSIYTHARERLVAGIQGGGSVRYLGDPQVTSGINGGGSVNPIGRN